MDRIYIIIVLFIILVILYLNNNGCGCVKKEHAGNVSPSTLSNEAIQNIASVYADTTGTASFNNVRATGVITGNVAGNLTGNVTGNVTGNLIGNLIGDVTGKLIGDVSGNLVGTDVSANKLCIGDTCVTELELKQMLSNIKCAGFAIDGEGTTMLLYEGYHRLGNGDLFDAWTNDKWDFIYCYKGWKIEVWKDYESGTKQEIENKIKDIPTRLDLKIGVGRNSASSYRATWIGY